MSSTARENRPILFSQVIDQEHVTLILKNAIKNKTIGQSLLFFGPKGSGKTTCARILAKALNCQKVTDSGEPCNSCNNCISKVNNGLFELDAASNNSVEDIRYIVDQVRYSPQNTSYNVFIIDEVHMLSNAAFNAFLKTLEEPPSHVFFILATTEKNKIISTILSRCQIFEFRKIKQQSIYNFLSSFLDGKKLKYETKAIDLIAYKSDGSMRDALSMLDSAMCFNSSEEIKHKDVLDNFCFIDESFFFALLEDVYLQKKQESFSHINSFYERGIDGQIFFQSFAQYLLDLLLIQNNIHSNRTAKTIDIDRYKEQGDKFTIKGLATILEFVIAKDILYKQSSCKEIVIDLLLIQILNLELFNHLREKSVKVENTEKKESDQNLKKTVKNIAEELSIAKSNVTGEEIVYDTSDLQDKINSAIEEFANDLKNKGKYIDYSVLVSRKKLESNSIVFFLTNSIQETVLNGLKTALSEYLSERFNIKEWHISAQLSAQKIQKNPEPTTLEKMKDKFSIINDLIEDLGIDLD